MGNELIEPKFKNGCYTWTNRQSREASIAQKLDRLLLSKNWNSSRAIWEAFILTIIGSYHFPISLLL